MRRATFFVALLPLAALAHVVLFTLELPRFTGNYPADGGIFTVQWVDQVAAGPKATVALWATQAAWGPFEAPDASLLISPDVAPGSPVNLFDWDTSDAGEGCWQPYAVIDDPIEGVSFSKATGRVTVVRGANVPPAIWVTTSKTELPDRDARLTLEWELDEPDDPSRVTILWTAGDGDEGTLAANLPISAGTRTASYTFDVHRLPPKPIWLKLEVRSGDAGFCDAWWSGFVTGRSDELVDAGVDAGSPTDAGADAGPADAGTEVPITPRGCGCHSGAEALCLGLLALARFLCRSR